MQQMVQRSVRCYSGDKMMCNVNNTQNFIETCSVIRFLRAKHVSPTEIHRQLIEVNADASL
jgi:hypothetical protein